MDKYFKPEIPKSTPTSSNTSTNTNSNNNYLKPNIDTSTYIKSTDRAVYIDSKIISAERIVCESNPTVDHWKNTNK